MTKRTILFTGAIVVLILWLLMRHVSAKTVYSDAIKVSGLPQMNYVVPPISTDNPSQPTQPNFDWFNGEQCGCDSGPVNAVVIQSTKLAPQNKPSYTYIPEYTLDIPPALKGVPTLDRVPPMPNAIIYQAPVPTFWWEMRFPQLYIATSDGFLIKNPKDGQGGFKVIADPSPIGKITVIQYNAQQYVLDPVKGNSWQWM